MRMHSVILVVMLPMAIFLGMKSRSNAEPDNQQANDKNVVDLYVNWSQTTKDDIEIWAVVVNGGKKPILVPTTMPGGLNSSARKEIKGEALEITFYWSSGRQAVIPGRNDAIIKRPLSDYKSVMLDQNQLTITEGINLKLSDLKKKGVKKIVLKYVVNPERSDPNNHWSGSVSSFLDLNDLK